MTLQTSPPSVQQILDRLEHVRRAAGGGWSARCPAHCGRSKTSLSVNVGADGRLLLHCHGGCPTSAVLAALELRPADLFAGPPDRPRWKLPYGDFVEKARRLQQPRRPEPPTIDLLPHARRWFAAADRRPLAEQLAVSVDALDKLRVGRAEAQDLAGLHNAPRPAWTWPMRDADGSIIGVRLRYDDGSKRAVTGSRQGLFFSPDVTIANGLLYVVEGASDTAALLTLGFNNVVGLPSAGQGADLVGLLIQRLSPPTPRCILIADRDEPGIAGMDRVARQLARWGIACRVTEPPGTAEDVRGYVQGGGDADGIDMLGDGEPEQEIIQ